MDISLNIGREVTSMNVLFLSLGKYWSIYERNIYTDLLRCFVNDGHKVYALSPIEHCEFKEEQIIRESGSTIIKVKTGNIQKTNIIEKGISTLLIESQFLAAVKKHFLNIQFDIVLYPTPPITFTRVVAYIKKRDHAFAYLMLKDIFPQNAVDIGMMRKTGVRGLLYRYFRNKEKRLYAVSDRIGCMSQANVDYVIRHNPEVDPSVVEICPNCIEVLDKSIDSETRKIIREKYGIPLDKKVFVYGGNLGKPQGIPFLIECLQCQKANAQAFFLIVGDGTEYGKLEAYVNETKQDNLKLMKQLPKDDYDTMVGACDVGMIFLDHRFTIPNFPSRLLSYMQAKLPVLACTDPNTDIGQVIIDGGFGWWCASNSTAAFTQSVRCAMEADLSEMGRNGWQYLQTHFTVEKNYSIISEKL